MDAPRRRRSRAAHDDQQLLLPFSKPEDLRIALDSIDKRVWRSVGIKSDARRRQVRELVMAVWWNGRNDGCRASVRALIDTANRNSDRPVIRNGGHFYEVLAAATAAGLILSEPDWNERGRTWSERQVGEDRIAELVRISREHRRSQKSELRRSHTRHSPDPQPTHPLLDLNHQTSESSKANQSTSSSALQSHTAHTTAEAIGAGSPLATPPEEEVAAFIDRVIEKFPGFYRAEEAIRHAIDDNGCSLEQLRARAQWFYDNGHRWPPEHRRGALYFGLYEARPAWPSDKGWPYL